MKKLILIILSAFSLISCDKFIAEDISEKTPVIILPAMNDTTNINPVHFKWAELEGATKYHLEVVSSGFSSINSFDVDTIIDGLEFYFALDSNEYEMRLTATNDAYNSTTTLPSKFWVGVQPSSGVSSLQLITPMDAIYMNESFNGFFDWSSISNASSYEVSIRKGTSFSSGILIDSEIGNSTGSFNSNATYSEGEYHWGVLAQLNDGSATTYITSTFFIDTVNPVLPVLSQPASLSNQASGTISFSWNNGQDTGIVMSPISSEIEISTDNSFPIGSTQFFVVQGMSTDIDLTSGTYFWRVKNIDDAGNESPYSQSYQLQVF